MVAALRGIVVVDDDPLMLAMLEPRLREGREHLRDPVKTFSSPDAALAWMAKEPHPPRVVLSDFNLKTRMTGLDLLVHVARTSPSTIRVLMSGYSREQIGLTSEAPIHGFVEKALLVEDMLREIGAIVARASDASASPATPAARPAAASPEPPRAPSAHAPPTREIIEDFVGTTNDFAIVALDTKGHVTSWNPGAERIKGWKANEILGRHFSAFYPPADVANHKPRYVLQRATEEGRFEDEGWRIRKDGSMFWANAVVTAVRHRGELTGFVKVTRDLTARRHAEEAVRQSEERYRLFIESVKDYAMFILDPTGHVMSWNEGAQRLKGYRADEIVGHHFRRFYTTPDRERHHPEEELTIALREGRYEEEGWRVRKDGTQFWASVTITALFDSDRKHVGFAKVTRDLTERKAGEEILRRRADSYAELNRELDAFSHSVAHDLRAPLRAVQSLSERILVEGDDRLHPDDKQSLRAIEESARQMGVLIQDLLDLSLTARKEPRREPIDVGQMILAIVDEKRALYPDRQIVPHVEPGLHAEADLRLLRVALANLVDNAIKFTKGPEVHIECGREMDPRGAYYVRDHGVGFAPDQADRLFRPFARLKNAVGVPGSGIGLTIVERIVRRHGGKIWVESEEGKGTTFRFTLGEAPPDVGGPSVTMSGQAARK